MKYALLLYTRPGAFDLLSDQERDEARAAYMAVRADTACLEGAQLHPVETATTLRERDGQPLVTDGPFADTKEVFAGYYVIEAADLDAATAIARRLPTARQGGAVEIRPAVEMPDAPEPGGR